MKKRRTMMESPRFQSPRKSKASYASVAKNVSRPTKSMLVTPQKVQEEAQTTKLKSSSRATPPEAENSMRVRLEKSKESLVRHLFQAPCKSV
jgi:hypothetical protein